MSYRGMDTTRFPSNPQDSSPGPYRGRGRGGGLQTAGRGRGRGRGGASLGTDINLVPVDQSYLPVAAHPAPGGVYRHPHASRARGWAGRGRGGQNSWSHSNNESSRSGHSTPRGYPPRNKPFRSSQAPAPRGGGLGFHLTNPSKPVLNRPSQLPEVPRTTRGTSDPRLWIPVKFVKATALTDKSLENPPKVDLADSEPSPKLKPECPKTSLVLEKIEPPLPEILPDPLPASPSDRLWEIEESTPASVEQWQTDFPGIFNKANSFEQELPSSHSVNGINSLSPNSGGSPKSHGIASEPLSTPVQPKELSSKSCRTGPEETVQVTPSNSDIQVPEIAVAAIPSADPGGLFFIDAEGDSSNRVLHPSVQVPNQPSTGKETDDEEERIVFRPDQSVTLTSKADDSHLFRTITDEVQVVSSDQPGSDPNPTDAKSPAFKPSKKAIKAQKRHARKERRRDTQDDRPQYPATHRPDDVDSGSDIDWGSDSVEGLADKNTLDSSSKIQRGVYKNKQEQELCEDYIKNSMTSELPSGEEADQQKLTSEFLNDNFTKTFMEGMAAQQKHTTIDELDRAILDRIDDDILRDWASDNSGSLDEKIEALDLHITDSDEESSEFESDDESSDGEDIDKTSLETSADVLTDSSDDVEDDEDDISAIMEDSMVKDPKGKRKGKKDADAELIEFIDDLQKKWKADRARKAEKKKARAEARLLCVTKSKKQKKKEQRTETSSPPPDVPKLHDMIRDFICFRIEEQVLNLPPVDKKTRAAIHEIANLYRMKSQSRGSGKRRYPVLTRTHRTTHILPSRQPLFRILNRFTDPAGHRASAVAQVPRNKEGALVGQGVAHIGSENVGFKLLTKMGWSLGQTIGDPENASALQKPIMAVMKNTKGGLGLSSPFKNY